MERLRGAGLLCRRVSLTFRSRACSTLHPGWAEAAGGEGAAGSRGSGEVAGEGEASAWRSRSTRPLLAWVTKRPAPPSSTVLAAVSGREAATVAGRRLPYSAPTRPSYGGNR